MRLIPLLFLHVAACAAPPLTSSVSQTPDALDAIAEDYVRLSLEIGTHEEGYIDAYYGPPEWRAEAEASPRSREALLEAVAALEARLDPAVLAPTDPAVMRRAAFLRAQLIAADTRLRMMLGERFSFGEEARGLFGVAPEIEPLESFDPVLARIETLVLGEGPLSERVDAYENRFAIPDGRLQPVFDAAIAECRRRTLAYIELPQNERFTLAFVTDKPWSGYNYYQGNSMSRIEINTDLPIYIGRAVDLGCHEGYPGHHAYNVLLERELVQERGWIEFSVYPLYSPQSLIAEGSANYGIDLAFPEEERLAFETRVLYPLAGLDPAEAERYFALQEAKEELAGARFTIAREYLEGRMTHGQAIAASQRYELRSRVRAEQSLDFIDAYRSYVINYGLGEELVRRFIESEGATPEARWAAMERILSEPTLPSDLTPAAGGASPN